MNLTLKLVLACGTALLVLCAVGVFSYRLAERSDRDQHWVTHTHDVLEQLDALDFDVKPPVNLDGAQEDIALLERLTADNPTQQRSLQQLKQLIFVQAYSNAPTAQSKDPAFGVRLNRQAAPIVRQMKQEEERLRTLRLAAMQASSQQIQFVVVLGNALTVLLVFIAAQVVRYEMSRRTQAEVLLRLKEEQFRLMSASVKEYSILNLDPLGYITTWNAGSERIKGYRAEEIIGQHFSKFYPPEDVAAGKTTRELETAARDSQCEDEGWRVRRDGSRFWAKVFITAVRDKKGVLLGFCKVTRDLTEERRVQAALQLQNTHLGTANNELDALMSDLRERQEMFERLFDSAPDALLLTNEAGTITAINKQGETLFGYTREELVGKSIEVLVPDHLRERHVSHREQYFHAPAVRPMGRGLNLSARRKDGTLCPVDLTLSPMRSKDGNVVLAAVRDITEQRAAQQSIERQNAQLEAANKELDALMSDLRERQEMFELLFDSAPDALLVTDEAGKIRAINKQSVALFGYQREELLGKSVDILVPEDLRPGHSSHREQYFHAPTVRPMGRGLNLSARRKDGTLCPVDLTLSPMRSKDGNVVLTAVRDITEQRNAQEAIERQNARLESANKELDALASDLRERQEMFERLFDSAPDALLLTNEAGTITAMNNQSEALFGYTREELVGKSVEVLIPVELRKRHVSHREQYFHAPTVRPMGRGLNLSARRKDGTLCPVDLTLSPMRSKDGNVVLAAVRDITEQRTAQEAIERQNTQLEAANKELDAFSYSVAHDLRAPLRAIDGFSQALVEDLKDNLGDESRATLQRVRSATARMAELIDDLLKLARISRYQAEKKQVDLSRLANDVAAQLQSSENNGRQVEFAIKPGLSAIGDRDLLRIVFENLMGNAWKFTSKKPDARIEFGVQNGGGERVFFVRDNGPGFDMQYANKLFGVFQRLHRESEFPGTGVGLATVQRIIHRHGGRIWAEATLEKGATFYFVL